MFLSNIVSRHFPLHKPSHVDEVYRKFYSSMNTRLVSCPHHFYTPLVPQTKSSHLLNLKVLHKRQNILVNSAPVPYVRRYETSEKPKTGTKYWTPSFTKRPSAVKHVETIENNMEQQQQSYDIIEDEMVYVQQTETQKQKFLSKVALETAKGLGISFSVAAAGVLLTSGAALSSAFMFTTAGIALVGGIAGAFGVSFMQPTYHIIKDSEGNDNIVSQDSIQRKMLSYVLYGSIGVGMIPILLISISVNPVFPLVAATITGSIMSGMVLYGLRQPQGSLQKWGAPLSIGLIGLIGVGILSLIFPIPGLALIASIGGVGLFSLLTAYDVQKSIELFEKGTPDVLGCAVGFFLNAVNLFQDILRILLLARRFFEGDE